MNVLAVCTALPEICVAAEGEGGRFLMAAEGKRQQAEDILPFMEEAAEGAGFSLKETQLITAAEGPGSFTGLRLGFSAAKAIQLSAGCPFIPVPTFEAWAMSLSGYVAPLFCVMDAKKKRYYCQGFASGKPLSEAMDMSAEEAANKICELLSGKEGAAQGFSPMLTLTEQHGKVLASDEAFIAALEAQKALSQKPVFQFAPVPCGGIFSMIALAKEKFMQRGGSPFSIEDYAIGPVYIRKSDAEEAREK